MRAHLRQDLIDLVCLDSGSFGPAIHRQHDYPRSHRRARRGCGASPGVGQPMRSGKVHRGGVHPGPAWRSFNDTTADQCSSPPVVPTIEPPGFEVGHFFITSRSRLPIGSGDLGSLVVLFAAMSKSETVVRGTNVRCSTCRHIQWVPVDKTAFACERCDAQLTRR